VDLRISPESTGQQPGDREGARKLLCDKRMSERFNTDEPLSWLALLGHEGGEMSQNELGNIVDRIDPIDKCAFVPLVTRLGRAGETNYSLKLRVTLSSRCNRLSR
jgi:hypothetical protein